MLLPCRGAAGELNVPGGPGSKGSGVGDSAEKGIHAPPPGDCGTGRATGGEEGRRAVVGRGDGVFVVGEVLGCNGPGSDGLG